MWNAPLLNDRRRSRELKEAGSKEARSKEARSKEQGSKEWWYNTTHPNYGCWEISNVEAKTKKVKKKKKKDRTL
jgi:hypothetical protein